MISLVLLGGLLLSGAAGQPSALVNRVKAVLTAEPGIVLKIEILQKQFDQVIVEKGTFEITDSGNCIYDSKTETIRMEGNTIETWDKHTRQLIIDKVPESEFSLFELLKGDFNRFQFNDSNPGDNEIDFSIPEAGISGVLSVKDPSSAIPEKIIVEYGPDQSLEIRIRSLEEITPPGLFHSFQPKPVAVIDLRE